MASACPLVFDAPPDANGTPRKLVQFHPAQTETVHDFTVMLATIMGVPLESVPTQPADDTFYPFQFYLLLTTEVRDALRVLEAVVYRLLQPIPAPRETADDGRDTICGCNHWWEEHEVGGGACGAPECDCQSFEYDPAANTPEAIADRGGEHQPGCQCALCCLTAATMQNQPYTGSF